MKFILQFFILLGLGLYFQYYLNTDKDDKKIFVKPIYKNGATQCPNGYKLDKGLCIIK